MCVCVCIRVTHRMRVYLHGSTCVRRKYISFARVRARARGRVVCGNLFNHSCHVEATWHPEAITSCVLEYFLNCSEMFRASPNDFHNRAVTWPFTPCEKNSCAFKNPPLCRFN